MSATGARWRNWGRTVSIRPGRVERPSSAAAVQRAVAAAAASDHRVKPVGAGHSFSDIASAPGVQLDLDALVGIQAVDATARRLTFGAGTRLRALHRLLEPLGLAMPNLGDIDRQSIAGAVSTGTHGTGLQFGGLATQIVAVTLVTGAGEMLTVSETENADMLPAVRIGLGAMGVIVDVTLQLEPRFLLAAVERTESLDAVLATWIDRVGAADHFEFYWFPHTHTAFTKTNTRLPAGAQRNPLGRVTRWIEDELLANGVYRGICAVGWVAPPTTPYFARLVERSTGNRTFTDDAPAVFTTNRSVRFREMEYAIPLAAVPHAVRAVRQLIDARRWRISFPIEVRAAAADENWLSPAYRRDTGYIAVHRYFREDPSEYFQAVEEIMVDFGGRPHWGKIHTRSAEQLRQSYSRFDDFLAVRERLDPKRLFTNSYLDRVLGA